MFASPFPANGSNSSSTSFGHTATSSATSFSQLPSTAALDRATEQLTLHDNNMSAPVASTSGTRGGIGTTNGEANGGGGGKQPRKRGRKRIEEDLTQIKGNDSLDADAKRKLQNRAAQRAFRERKEKHVSDLEARVQIQEQQLLEYSEVIRSLIAENEALRRGEQPPSTVLPASFGLGSFRSNASSASTASPPGHPCAYPAHSGSPEDVKPVIPRESHAAPQPTPVAANLPSALQSTSLPPVPSSSFLSQGAPNYAASFPRDLSPHPAGNPPPPQPPQVKVASRQPSPVPPPAPPVPMPLPPLNDVDMSFDFDAPFNFDDTTLPPLFTTMIDELLAAPPSSSNDPSLSVSSTSASDAPDPSDDVCELDDSDEPPPLPMGRIPCDKPECDFTAQSCLLPIPWRPPMAIGTDKDLWVAQKCWAKLVSHPLFGQCDSDELCQELRDKTRCSDDGRLVVPKSDVCDIFRSIPAKARLRQAQVAMQ